MQPYILNSFRRSSDGAIFTRVETGTNSGGYVYQQEVKRLRDFICDGNFTIYSVVKNIDGRIITHIVFTVGDRLSMQYGGSDIITNIKISNSEVLLRTGITDVTRVDLRVASKYVAPVVAPVQQVERRGPGRPTNAEIVARNNAITTFNNGIQTLEATILSRNTRPVRLEKTLIRTVRKLSLENFLIKFFKEWNAEKTTIYVDDKTVQTSTGRRRSLGDVYMICKYYYPECTLKQVLTLLYVTLNESITPGFRTSYCSTINKRVWYYSSISQNIQTDKNQRDEYGFEFQHYINLINA